MYVHRPSLLLYYLFIYLFNKILFVRNNIYTFIWVK